MERFNHTFKPRICIFLSPKQTIKWVFAFLVFFFLKSYSGSYHLTIGMAINKVTIDCQDRIWTRLYGDVDRYFKRHRKVEIGVNVCKRCGNGVFDKGYMPNWSYEQFILSLIKLICQPIIKFVTCHQCTHPRTIVATKYAVNGTRKRFSRFVTSTKSSGFLNDEQS